MVAVAAAAAAAGLIAEWVLEMFLMAESGCGNVALAGEQERDAGPLHLWALEKTSVHAKVRG